MNKKVKTIKNNLKKVKSAKAAVSDKAAVDFMIPVKDNSDHINGLLGGTIGLIEICLFFNITVILFKNIFSSDSIMIYRIFYIIIGVFTGYSINRYRQNEWKYYEAAAVILSISGYLWCLYFSIIVYQTNKDPLTFYILNDICERLLSTNIISAVYSEIDVEYDGSMLLLAGFAAKYFVSSPKKN